MQKLRTSDADFSRQFMKIVNARRESDSGVSGQVMDILRTVKSRGDAALVEYTQRFDGYSLIDDADWVVTRERCEEAYSQIETEQREALDLAATRIRAYHTAQLPKDRDYEDNDGVRLGA
ncbi:MAG: histidinol dehydrogenase, partial [Pseudomonadota bacterium]